MKEAHARAAAAIFETRNKSASGGSGKLNVDATSAGVPRLPVDVFDLHGLHPTEASEVAEEVRTVSFVLAIYLFFFPPPLLIS